MIAIWWPEITRPVLHAVWSHEKYINSLKSQSNFNQARQEWEQVLVAQISPLRRRLLWLFYHQRIGLLEQWQPSLLTLLSQISQIFGLLYLEESQALWPQKWQFDSQVHAYCTPRQFHPPNCRPPLLFENIHQQCCSVSCIWLCICFRKGWLGIAITKSCSTEMDTWMGPTNAFTAIITWTQSLKIGGLKTLKALDLCMNIDRAGYPIQLQSTVVTFLTNLIQLVQRWGGF